MQKRVLTKAIALAVATLGSGAAFAQSSLTIYGNIDVGFDHVKRTLGDPAGGSLSTKLSTNRVGPDLSSQSSLGFRGTEDLGDGMKAGFVLEGQVGADNGALLRDGRMFGRQAFASVTTPYGEVRIGRQYAPIFFSSALVTSERFGATDLYLEGGLTNNMNIRWDNTITYSAQVGAFRAQLGYSPQAGVGPITNANRGATASAAAGSILGGNNSAASNENSAGRGRSLGAFGAYSANALTVTLGYSQTNMGNSSLNLGTGVATSATTGAATATYLGDMDKYRVWNLGAKYEFKELGLQFNGAFGRATYDFNTIGAAGLAFDLPSRLNVSSLVLGTRYNIGSLAFLAQWSETKFRNGPRSKDNGYSLGIEYSLSKRTTLYSRYYMVKDKDGGPDVLFGASGVREVPVAAGAGISPDGKTTLIGVGVRHSF